MHGSPRDSIPISDHASRTDDVPAIVVGRGLTGLGTLRSLVLAGIPAYVACPAGDLVTHSRWYRPLPGAGWDGTIDAQAEARLQALPLTRAVFIAGADDAAMWLAERAQRGADARFSVSSSTVRTLEILQDKDRFGALLADSGLSHPRTFPLQRREDVARIPFAELDRIFLKPVDSQRFSLTFGYKGVWVDGEAELLAAWEPLHAAGHAMVAQEYIPGASSDHYFLDGFRDRHGQLCGLMARRRLRIYPPDFGNSSYCHTVPLDELAGASADLSRLLAALDYRGIFSAEFKRDARTGQHCLLEINTRAWWYVEFAAHCGVNVAAMAYADALEQPVPHASRHYAAAGCVSFDGDLATVMRQRLDLKGWLRVLSQWWRAHYHVLRRDDPRPGLWFARQWLRHRWNGLFARNESDHRPADSTTGGSLRR